MKEEFDLDSILFNPDENEIADEDEENLKCFLAPEEF
jgi:hypothetical protein